MKKHNNYLKKFVLISNNNNNNNNFIMYMKNNNKYMNYLLLNHSVAYPGIFRGGGPANFPDTFKSGATSYRSPYYTIFNCENAL